MVTLQVGGHPSPDNPMSVRVYYCNGIGFKSICLILHWASSNKIKKNRNTDTPQNQCNGSVKWIERSMNDEWSSFCAFYKTTFLSPFKESFSTFTTYRHSRDDKQTPHDYENKARAKQIIFSSLNWQLILINSSHVIFAINCWSIPFIIDKGRCNKLSTFCTNWTKMMHLMPVIWVPFNHN